MVIYPNVRPGVFLSRPNRFLAHVGLNGREEICHVKNTGRCRELLIPGAGVYCQHHSDPRRKTEWSLITVEKGTQLVNIDSQVPNRLAAEWVAGGGLGGMTEHLRRERIYGDSRFDLSFELAGRTCFLEVKGVTLEEGGVARFPDAPTARGEKHLRGLLRAVQEGYGAYVLFVVQLAGVERVEPNWAADPAFSQALLEAAAGGVEVLAVGCDVTRDAIAIARTLPVNLT